MNYKKQSIPFINYRPKFFLISFHTYYYLMLFQIECHQLVELVELSFDKTEEVFQNFHFSISLYKFFTQHICAADIFGKTSRLKS